jgi:hypothetical protein
MEGRKGRVCNSLYEHRTWTAGSWHSFHLERRAKDARNPTDHRNEKNKRNGKHGKRKKKRERRKGNGSQNEREGMTYMRARVKALRTVTRVEEERLAALHLPELVSQTFNLRSDHKTNVRVRSWQGRRLRSHIAGRRQMCKESGEPWRDGRDARRCREGSIHMRNCSVGDSFRRGWQRTRKRGGRREAGRSRARFTQQSSEKIASPRSFALTSDGVTSGGSVASLPRTLQQRAGRVSEHQFPGFRVSMGPRRREKRTCRGALGRGTRHPAVMLVGRV